MIYRTTTVMVLEPQTHKLNANKWLQNTSP